MTDDLAALFSDERKTFTAHHSRAKVVDELRDGAPVVAVSKCGELHRSHGRPIAGRFSAHIHWHERSRRQQTRRLVLEVAESVATPSEDARMHEEVVPVLRISAANRAVQWYARLGFRKEWEHQFEPGFPWFVSVARGDLRLYLSEHTGDAPPNGLVHLYVSDVDAVAAEFGVSVDEEGLAGRECALVDPDGNRLRVATRRS